MSGKDEFRIAFQNEMLHCVYFVITASREPDDAARKQLVEEAAAYIGRAADAMHDEMLRLAQHGGLA